MQSKNILSLFNGMSCSRMALDELNIPIKNFYSSEVDKFANQLTNYLYPDTINLGDVRIVDVSNLEPIDIIFAGSPCQSFSFAGKRKGMATKCEEEILNLEKYLELKSQGFEFEGQSYLFWEFVRIYQDCKKINPEVKFLLENVEMGEKWEKVLSKAVGYNGIHINSALVSAQNRKRIYWINFGLEPQGLFGDLESIVRQPKDNGILLKDILESEVNEKYFLSEKMVNCLVKRPKEYEGFKPVEEDSEEKSKSINARIFKMGTWDNYVSVTNKENRSDSNLIVHNTMPRSSTTGKGGTGPLSRADGKTYCLDTKQTNAIELRGVLKFGITEEAKEIRKESLKNGRDFTPFQAKEISDIDFEKSNCVTSVQKDNLLIVAERGRQDKDGKWVQQLEQNNTGKTNSLTTVQKDNLLMTRELIIHNIPEIVNVRKYEVDILFLQKTLKEHKNITNQQIADALNVPKTMVEHWFRTDNYFSIPDKDVWLRLKELLGIVTEEFDESIMVFEQREGVFDKSNRVYDEEGIAPTLTSTSADERILVREVKQLNPSLESNNKQPYQQNRVYDTEGIAPALCGNKADLLIKTDEEDLTGVNIILTNKDKRLQKIVDDNTFIDGEVAHLDTYNQTIDKEKSPALKLPHNDRFIFAPTKSIVTSGTLRTHKDGEGFREVKSGKGGTVPARAREDGSGQNVVMITNELNENQQKKFNPNVNSDKANALTLAQGRAGSSSEYMDSVSKIANITSRIRRLTPKECLRLQTVPENLIDKILASGISDSQIYKMAGNGWTIKVISHLLTYL
jgi:site-specific DNA-cytosine methylase